MKRKYLHGQGMVSFLVAAVFLFIPISLGINYLAKLGDARHKSYEAARYAVWERTVWSPSDATYNVKTTAEINNETVRRVFGRATLPLDSHDDKADGSSQLSLESNLTLWSLKGHRSSVLEPFDDGLYSSLTLTNNNISGGLSQAVNDIAALIDLNKRGFYSAGISFRLSRNSILVPELTMASPGSEYIEAGARSALLVEAWNAANKGEVEARVERTLLTSHFDNSAFNTLRTSIAVFHPEIKSLLPGIVEAEVVPCHRITNPGSNEKCI